jgi:hypothetical protein
MCWLLAAEAEAAIVLETVEHQQVVVAVAA